MQLDQILIELGHGLGLAGLVLDEDRTCRLELDQGHRLTLRHRPELNALDLVMPLELPERDEAGTARLCRRLLEIQLLGEATRGAVIGLDEEEGTALVQRRLWLRDALETREVAAAMAELNGVAHHLVAELDLLPPED